jgi:hypothetical protein
MDDSLAYICVCVYFHAIAYLLLLAMAMAENISKLHFDFSDTVTATMRNLSFYLLLPSRRGASSADYVKFVYLTGRARYYEESSN